MNLSLRILVVEDGDAASRQFVSEVITRHVAERAASPVETRKRPHDTLTSAKRALNHRLFSRAKVLLREAIKELPDSAEPRYLMGVLEEMRGKRRAACKEYRAALQIDPDFEPAKVRLVQCEDDAWN